MNFKPKIKRDGGLTIHAKMSGSGLKVISPMRNLQGRRTIQGSGSALLLKNKIAGRGMDELASKLESLNIRPSTARRNLKFII